MECQISIFISNSLANKSGGFIVPNEKTKKGLGYEREKRTRPPKFFFRRGGVVTHLNHSFIARPFHARI
jgi:hypothetical protein